MLRASLGGTLDMHASAYVGRVGGLAVALGIGFAVTLSGATAAWADPADSSSSGGGPTTGTASTGVQAPRSSGRNRGGRSTAGSASATTTSASTASRGGTQTATAVVSAPVNNSSPATKVSTSAPAVPHLAVATDAVDLRSVSAATNTTAEFVAGQSVTATAVVAPLAASVVPTATLMVAQPAATAGGLDSALNRLLGNGPLAPVQSAMSWVVLAAARRERGGSSAAHSMPVAVVSTSDPADTPSVPVAVSLTGTAARPAAALTASTDAAQALTPVAAVTAADPITAFIGQIQAFVTQVVQGVTQFVTQVLQAVTQAVAAIINVFAPAPPNAAPIASDPTVGTPDPVTGVITGRVSASDPNGESLTYAVSATAAKGTTVINSTTGDFIYTPNATARHAAAQTGAAVADKTDTFTITISDGKGGTTTSVVNVPISPANAAPVAGAATAGTPDATTGAVIGEINATDPEGDPLTYSAPSTTTKGSININASTGSFSYTPTATARQDAAQSGASAAITADTFNVTITDGYGGNTTVPVTVAISPNHPPVAGSTTVGTPDPFTGAVTGSVTATDPDGNPLTYSGSTSTSKGSVTVATSGGFSYTPTATARHSAAQNGATAAATADSFTVTISDGQGGTSTVPVTVTVSPANSAPVGGTATVSTPDATSGTVTGTASATDANGDTLTYSGSTSTAKGSVTVAANGSFTYTPTATARHTAAMIGASPQTTTDTFTIAISDGYGGTTTMPVTVAIGPTNASPVAGTPSVGTPNAMTGMLTGTVNATDPEGDTLTYNTTANPTKGTVAINANTGTFSYTPTPSARGVAASSDSFTVTVTDGFGGSTALVVAVPVAAAPVANAMITYVFNYGSGAQYWSSDATNALEVAANRIASYIVVAQPVTLTFDVTAAYAPSSNTLASAGSDLIASQAGFYSTVVQNKLLTGVDSNGSAADGTLDVNFGTPYAFGDSVGVTQYDFESTMMHEMMHAYGFLSYLDEAGWNTYTQWTTFDSFIVNSTGNPVVDPGTHHFNAAYNPNLTGGNGGLYFGGANAEAAYGGPVPLYAPSVWAAGSSISHLDDGTFVGANAQLMNAMIDTGLGVRTLSPVEQGILKDLGYTV